MDRYGQAQVALKPFHQNVSSSLCQLSPERLIAESPLLQIYIMQRTMQVPVSVLIGAEKKNVRLKGFGVRRLSKHFQAQRVRCATSMR